MKKYLGICAFMCTCQVLAQEESQTQEASQESQTQEASQESQTQEASQEGLPASVYQMFGEGKTLPHYAFRLRLIQAYSSASENFNKDGKKEAAAFELKAAPSAMVLEYGLSDSISIQAMLPVMMSKDTSYNTKYKESTSYQTNLENGINSMAVVGSKKLGKTFEETKKYILANGPAPIDIDLSAGEKIPKGTRLLDFLKGAIESSAKEKTEDKGKAGIGDLELGILYSVINEKGPWTNNPIHFSAGLGTRFPTGSFGNENALEDTGRGTWDIGLRLNLDYLATPWLVFAWQNVTEQMLRKGWKDIEGKEQKFEREGLRNLGFVKAQMGFGAFSESLEFLSLIGAWDYAYNPQEKLDGEETAKANYGMGPRVGLFMDGLPLKIPAQLLLEYSTATHGENGYVIPSTFKAELRGYARF